MMGCGAPTEMPHTWEGSPLLGTATLQNFCVLVGTHASATTDAVTTTDSFASKWICGMTI